MVKETPGHRGGWIFGASSSASASGRDCQRSPIAPWGQVGMCCLYETRPAYNWLMSYRWWAVLVLMFVVLPVDVLPVNAQTFAVAASVPAAPIPHIPQHRFWDRENVFLFSGVAVARGLDYASTRNMLARGRQEILLPDDVVNSSAGFPALEAAGVATSVGISYIFHRTGHHMLERWLSIGHISVAGFGVARNYSLKSGHYGP